MQSATRLFGPIHAEPPETHDWLSALAYASLHAVAAGWLLITGIAAAFAVPTRTGGLVLAVNGVAATAYVLLARNRLVLGVSSAKAATVRTTVRSVDWMCTFPPMQIEVLFLLGIDPTKNTLEFALLPALASVVVGFDLSLRAAFVEMRNAPLLWGGVQLVAAAMFVVMLVVLSNATAVVVPDDRSVTLVFVYLWCAYPVVAFVSDGVRWGTTFNPELIEDVLFTLLDVASKAGLATHVALRN